MPFERLTIIIGNVRLERFKQETLSTSILSPDKKKYIWINNTDWGVYNADSGKNVPLPRGSGGTGVSSVAEFMSEYKLTAGLPAIGVPFFWPSAAMPNTVIDEWSDMVFLKFNGATFSASLYPKLAAIIPSLTLPEARGEFPRIWDDGRGVDTGRVLLSAQGDAIRNMTGTVFGLAHGSEYGGSNGVFSGTTGGVIGSGSSSGGVTHNVNFDASNGGVPTASENRPRNIAFNFLVRAK